jgi:hypothetical protein
MAGKLYLCFVLVFLLAINVPVVSASATYSVTAAPTITVSPSSGGIGTSVLVTGSGFSSSSTITITFDGIIQSTAPSTVTSTSDGRFICYFTVPAYLVGAHVVQAIDVSTLATATFTITVPTVTITPASGSVGSTVTISGSGFATSSTLSVKFDGALQVTNPISVTSSSSGTFTCTFSVPSSVAGIHTIQVTDALGNSGTTSYVVTVPTYTLTVTSDASTYAIGAQVTISGLLTATTNSPAAGYLIGIKVTDPLGGTEYTTIVTTNSAGTYTITFLSILGINQPTGAYTITATASSNGNQIATASTTYTVTSSPQSTIILEPTSGIVGKTIKVTGSGFANSVAITVRFDGVSLTTTPATVTSSSSGNFICYFSVPNYLPGAHTVQAIDSTHSATATFTITVPTVTITPASGSVGSTVTISGSGFASSSALSVKFDGTLQTTNPSTVTSSSSGTFTCTFIVPSSVAGAHTIQVTDGSSNSATAVYTITTITPTPTPIPTVTPTPSPTPSPSTSPSEWNALLTSSQNSYSDTCTFGARSDATNDFNAAYDQVKSPSPPQGVYSYFYYSSNPTSPVNLQKLGVSIIGPWPADNVNWNYQVKAVGSDGLMVISWSNIATIPSTYVVSLLNGTNNEVVANMRQASSYSFQATADITYSFIIQVITNTQFTLHLSAGWNMVSLPIIPSNPSFSNIFSNVGYYQVLTWNGNGYVTPTTVEAGKGYWVLVLDNAIITITGTPVTSYQLNVQPGWSMIGSIDGKPVSANSLFDGQFYQLLTWNGSQYITTTTITVS